MIQNLVRRALTVAAFATVLAVPAAAQSFGFGFGVGGHGRHHGGFGVGIGFQTGPVYAPVYRPVVTGHYEVVTRQVWVEGCERQVWVNPVTEVRFDRFGVAYTAEVRCGYWTTVRDAGHYETRTEQVWVSGC